MISPSKCRSRRAAIRRTNMTNQKSAQFDRPFTIPDARNGVIALLDTVRHIRSRIRTVHRRPTDEELAMRARVDDAIRRENKRAIQILRGVGPWAGF
jgi:hypothetical protein